MGNACCAGDSHIVTLHAWVLGFRRGDVRLAARSLVTATPRLPACSLHRVAFGSPGCPRKCCSPLAGRSQDEKLPRRKLRGWIRQCSQPVVLASPEPTEVVNEKGRPLSPPRVGLLDEGLQGRWRRSKQSTEVPEPGDLQQDIRGDLGGPPNDLSIGDAAGWPELCVVQPQGVAEREDPALGYDLLLGGLESGPRGCTIEGSGVKKALNELEPEVLLEALVPEDVAKLPEDGLGLPGWLRISGKKQSVVCG